MTPELVYHWCVAIMLAATTVGVCVAVAYAVVDMVRNF